MDHKAFKILKIIDSADCPITAKIIFDKVSFAKSTMQGHIRWLWDNCYIDREDLGIAKGFMYVITEKGKEVLDESKTD
jgi:predicted transcriptional regulator